METKAKDIDVRPATLKDAESIFSLIRLNSDQLVQRSLGNIVENIDRFSVALSGGEILGCATYQVHPEIGQSETATVEIQSVAVGREHRRTGIGTKLVRHVIDRASTIEPGEFIVLTFAPEFFKHLGFREVPKTKVMHKLYTGCINCTKYRDPFTCPELAMVFVR